MFDLLPLYWKHLTELDGLILLMGMVVLVGQFAMGGYLTVYGRPQPGRQADRVRACGRWSLRISTVGIDVFPLLGLLGTVAALLVTFAGMGQLQDSTEIIADFAPGLTTTISGLVMAVVNLAAFHLFLVPRVGKVLPELLEREG